MSIEAMKQARSVISSINSGRQHEIKKNGETVFWQREEWVRWGLDEVLPLIDQAIAEAEKQEPVAWTENDMAYRPNGLPQEFIHHEVESHDDWSEWVCPKPEQYFLKCCDCGLVHEAQFRVAKYGEGDYCELVEDKDTQAQFRMRRRTTPQQRKPLTDEEIESLADSLEVWNDDSEKWILDSNTFARAIEAAHGIKGEV
jgi:hypothetical protein